LSSLSPPSLLFLFCFTTRLASLLLLTFTVKSDLSIMFVSLFLCLSMFRRQRQVNVDPSYCWVVCVCSDDGTELSQ
jgi:hypothetical protein